MIKLHRRYAADAQEGIRILFLTASLEFHSSFPEFFLLFSVDGGTTVARKQIIFHCCLRDAVLLQERGRSRLRTASNTSTLKCC